MKPIEPQIPVVGIARRRKLIWASVAFVIIVLGGATLLQSDRGGFLYGGNLGTSVFRYEVYTRKRLFGFGMPGDGSSGPALVVVYNDSNTVIFEKNIQTALSEVDYLDGKLSIAGEGAWLLEKSKK
jgi:hypothetical protein